MARTLLLALLIALLAPASARAQALPDRPDLTIGLPEDPYSGQRFPVYLDAYQEPGKLLYRFDSLIHNEGGTLDLFRDEGSGHVMQAVWQGGEPTTPPDPSQPPPAGPDVEIHDRDASGARFEYVFEETHDHWHFFSAARYELDVPGAPTRVSGKIGFCLFDSFDTGGPEKWFPSEHDNGTFCGFDHPDGTFVRMGLSPGMSDRYSAQREFQYVDMTGLAPGTYLLRGIANPSEHLLEDDPSDNVTEQLRVLPGVRAAGLDATAQSGTALPLALPAEVVAPEVPARRSGSCSPSAFLQGCYVTAADAPVTFAVTEPPQHGTVAVGGAGATYTPAPGFEGADRFSYTATDARGLTSAPATVELRVQPPAATPPPVPAAPGRAAPRKLLRIGPARRTRRALTVRILCRPAAVGRCTGALTAKLAGRRVGRRAYAGLPTGRTSTVRIRLSRAARRAIARSPGRRVVLTATVRDAQAAGVVARRVVVRRSLG